MEGYTPVPATATLSDVKMCTGYTFSLGSSSTRSQCRTSCDLSFGCEGFSWGVRPPLLIRNHRRTLLAHDDEVGLCYLIMTAITTSSVDSGFIQAGCYKKGTLPVA